MKKSFYHVFFILIALTTKCFADDFTDAIQDPAVRTACVGQYSMTEAGGGWYDDPHDYYTPQLMASRVAQESGNMTRTTTFYGICFDYAQFAYQYVEKYQSWYNSKGMYERQFWIAGVHGKSSEITLSYPGDKSNYTTVQNGVYVKYPKDSTRKVQAHDKATYHAWFWIQRADGVWFWIDPTWTDNTGYIWYGYISENGKEIQCHPNKAYCVNYPNYLNNLPLPPAMGQKESPSKTANSTNPEETIKDAGKKWNEHAALLLSLSIPYKSFSEGFSFSEKAGYEFDFVALYGNSITLFEYEYLRNHQGNNCLDGGIIAINSGKRLFNFLGGYWGLGFGLRFDGTNDAFLPKQNSDLLNTLYLAFKVDAGILITVSDITGKLEIAYDNVLGLTAGFGLGIDFL